MLIDKNCTRCLLPRQFLLNFRKQRSLQRAGLAASREHELHGGSFAAQYSLEVSDGAIMQYEFDCRKCPWRPYCTDKAMSTARADKRTGQHHAGKTEQEASPPRIAMGLMQACCYSLSRFSDRYSHKDRHRYC